MKRLLVHLISIFVTLFAAHYVLAHPALAVTLTSFEFNDFTDTGTKYAGVPFDITITAKDENGDTMTSFNGQITLTDDTATIHPSSTSSFVNGVWSGQVYITEAATSTQITATYNPIASQSDAFTVAADSRIKFLTISQGNNQSGLITTTLPLALKIKVVDPFNNPISGVGVNWAITSYPPSSTTQSLNSLSGTSNASGEVTTSLTLGRKAGTYVVTAQLTSGVTNTAHFYETATAGSLVSISLSPQWAVLPAGNFIPFTASGFDTYSNPVSLSSATWSVVNSGGTIDSTGIFYAGSTTGTFLNTVRITSGSTGAVASVSIINEDSGGSGSGGTPTPTPEPSPTPTVTPTPSNTGTPTPTSGPSSTPTPTPTAAAGVLSSLNIDPDILSALAGATIPILAEGVDAYGNPVTGVNYEFDIEGNLGTLSEAVGNTVLLTASDNGIGTLTVTATQGNVSRVARIVGSVGTGLNRRLVIDPIASPQEIGKPFLISIAAKDSLNNFITDYDGPLVLSDTTGTLDPAVASPSAEGIWYVQGIIGLAHPEVAISVAGDGMVGVSNVFEVTGDLKKSQFGPGSGGAGGGGGDIKGASVSAEFIQQLFKTKGLDKYSVLRYIGAGLAAGFGILGASIGGGLMASRGLEAIGRNPFAKGRLQFNLYASIIAFIVVAVLAVAAAVLIVR